MIGRQVMMPYSGMAALVLVFSLLTGIPIGYQAESPDAATIDVSEHVSQVADDIREGDKTETESAYPPWYQELNEVVPVERFEDVQLLPNPLHEHVETVVTAFTVSITSSLVWAAFSLVNVGIRIGHTLRFLPAWLVSGGVQAVSTGLVLSYIGYTAYKVRGVVGVAE